MRHINLFFMGFMFFMIIAIRFSIADISEKLDTLITDLHNLSQKEVILECNP